MYKIFKVPMKEQIEINVEKNITHSSDSQVIVMPLVDSHVKK